MKFAALLRGVNVGGNRKVNMKSLKALFESYGYTNVFTYLNSGNVLFESNKSAHELKLEITCGIQKEYGFEVPTLVKTLQQMKTIAAAIPEEWKNDTTHKTDVAYLFPEIDKKTIIDDLPIKKEYLEIHYVKGALIWNIDRKNYNKSQLNKIVSHDYYQLMTIRNVNTARRLALS